MVLMTLCCVLGRFWIITPTCTRSWSRIPKPWWPWSASWRECRSPLCVSVLCLLRTVCVDSVCGVVVSRTSGLGVRWRVTPLILCGFTRAWFWRSWTGCRPEWPTGPNNRAGRWDEELILSYSTQKINSFYLFKNYSRKQKQNF